MRLPLSYSIRNISRRPWRTALTVLGISVVVFAAILMMAMSRGVVVRLNATGERENVLAISRKGQNNMFSSISNDEVVHLWSIEAVAKSAEGTPLVSPEIMHVPFVEVESVNGIVRAPVSVRGVNPVGFEVHQSIKLRDGRLPQNSFELIAGSAAHSKLGVEAEALATGSTISFENREWTITGTFEAGGSLFESEIWANESDLMTVLRRRSHTFVVMRLTHHTLMKAALSEFDKSGPIERYFKGWSEVGYYQEFMTALAWVRWLSLFMVVAIGIAGALIGINTMYSAVIGRLSEIAVQRVLGFSGLDIATALAIEGVVIALIGGVAGALGGMLVNGIPMAFSQGAFFLQVDLWVMAAGVGLSLAIGVFGALLPAIKGLRMGILEAMRHA